MSRAVASASAAAPSARERLLVAAECAFAQQGVLVPLRDIAVLAGHRNNSAVNYHFGDRDGLVSALLGFRAEALERPRMEALARLEATGRGDDPHGLIEVLVEPMFALSRAPDAAYYARCLELLRAHPAFEALTDPARGMSLTVRMITSRLSRTLQHIPSGQRAARLRSMSTAMFALLADHEAAHMGEAKGSRREAQARGDIVRMLVGLLSAPGK